MVREQLIHNDLTLRQLAFPLPENQSFAANLWLSKHNQRTGWVNTFYPNKLLRRYLPILPR